MNWMIYGCYGYTGELIAREAVARGMQPLLAGRNEQKVQALATELGLKGVAVGLSSPTALDDALVGVDLVLHCAGPFSATSEPMIAACLRKQSHYLDITGEISVFEHAQSQHVRAQEAGIVICPGVGFDVIPTDCVAAALKQALPDATQLALGFDSRSGFSPGTAKTSVEGLAQGGKVRLNGKIEQVPLAYHTRKIDFGDGEKLAMTIPWGDVATAYFSTGIPNIEVFIPGSPRMVKNAKRANYVRWLLSLGPVQEFLKKKAGQAQGPDAATRAKLPTYVWGEATNAAGQKRVARIKTANGYSLTVTGSLAVVEHLLSDEHGHGGGYYTPSRLLGPKLVETLPDSETLTLTDA